MKPIYLNCLKQLANATLEAIYGKILLTVKIGVSESATSATMNQDEHPVAFHSKPLQRIE